MLKSFKMFTLYAFSSKSRFTATTSPSTPQQPKNFTFTKHSEMSGCSISTTKLYLTNNEYHKEIPSDKTNKIYNYISVSDCSSMRRHGQKISLLENIRKSGGAIGKQLFFNAEVQTKNFTFGKCTEKWGAIGKQLFFNAEVQTKNFTFGKYTEKWG
jgi:hypothetical protein